MKLAGIGNKRDKGMNLRLGSECIENASHGHAFNGTCDSEAASDKPTAGGYYSRSVDLHLTYLQHRNFKRVASVCAD